MEHCQIKQIFKKIQHRKKKVVENLFYFQKKTVPLGMKIIMNER